MKHVAPISVAGLLAGLLLVPFCPPPPLGAQEFRWAGTWRGEFQATTKPDRDLAVRGEPGALGGAGGRDRLIQGAGVSKCEGTWTLTFRGEGEDLEGAGVMEQVCQVAREGTRQPPPERFFLEDIKIKDKGEGKDKEMEFKYRTALDRATICRGKGKFKPKDGVFEGRFDCRKELRAGEFVGSDAEDRDRRRTLTISPRGEFKLTRGGM